MEEEEGEENNESTDDRARRRVARPSLPDLSIATSPRREEAKPASAGTSSQDLAHRHNYACEFVPVKQYLQGSLKEETKGCTQPVGYTIHT
jgi:aminoglycoside/choline kinase family phosphotransferase